MTERDEAAMEPLLREVLLSEPEILAWLEPPVSEDDEEMPTASSRGGG